MHFYVWKMYKDLFFLQILLHLKKKYVCVCVGNSWKVGTIIGTIGTTEWKN